MAAYFFQSPVDVDILLEDEDVRKHVDVKMEKERVALCPVYYDGDTIAGQVSLSGSLLLQQQTALIYCFRFVFE